MSSPPGRRLSFLPALARFWADDRGLSVFSVLLLVNAFALPLLGLPAGGRSLVGDTVYALLLLSGVLALGERMLVRGVLLPAALAALAVILASWVVSVPPGVRLGTGVVSLLVFLAVVLGQTLRRGPITYHRLLGAVAAYLLLGLVWADGYALVELLRPGSFTGPIVSTDGPRAFLYFSFATLTTTGYGDVLPVHAAARSLANLEAVTGTLYIAILLARLVSMAGTPAKDGQR